MAAATGSRLTRNTLIFVGCALVWLALDVFSKQFFNGFQVGQLVGGPYAGLIQFRLVHNTGAAWGMFGDSTFALGIVSCLVCVGIIALFAIYAKSASPFVAIGAALVCAGGLGNAIDRFTLGYVVDFIETAFMDFPVFNVADIGVTCGFVLIIVGLLLAERAVSREIDALEEK